VRLKWLLLVTLGVALAGCGQLELPSEDAPTYVRWVTPAQPYPNAVAVRLTIENDHAWVGKTLVERSHPARTLSSAERQAFEHALHRVRLLGFPPRESGADAACFVPHHFFRYYDARGRQIGQVAVCFCCLGAKAQPRLPFETGESDTLRVDLPAVKTLVQRLGLRTDVACSPEEVKVLHELSGVEAQRRQPYRITRAPFDLIAVSTSAARTIEVSPGVVIASAPWAAPYSTAICGPSPSRNP
jgi:hypothetical protein